MASLGALLSFTSPSTAIVDGAIPACTDRRFDCVGLLLVKAPDGACPAYGIAGSCVLIAPDRVMTVHHSVTPDYFNSGESFAPTQMRVRFRRATNGLMNSEYHAGNEPNDCNANTMQEVDVAEIQVMPYAVPDPYGDPNDPDNPNPMLIGPDLAVLRLVTPVRFIKPAGIEPFPAEGQPLIAAGWGYNGQCLCQGEHWALRTAPSLVPMSQWDFYYSVSYGGYQRFFTPCFQSVYPYVEPAHECPDTFNPGCPLFGASQTTVPCPSDWPAGAVANLHDSGGPIFHVHNCGGGEASDGSGTELRLVGIINSQSICVRSMAWNEYRTPDQYLLPPTPTTCSYCRVDINSDGAVTSTDILDFLRCWFQGACIADWTKEGTISVHDINAFLSAWFAGCPGAS